MNWLKTIFHIHRWYYDDRKGFGGNFCRRTCISCHRQETRDEPRGALDTPPWRTSEEWDSIRQARADMRDKVKDFL